MVTAKSITEIGEQVSSQSFKVLETGLRDKVVAEHGNFHEAANCLLCGVMGKYVWHE